MDASDNQWHHFMNASTLNATVEQNHFVHFCYFDTQVVYLSEILGSSQRHFTSLEYISWPKTSMPVGGIRWHSLFRYTQFHSPTLG